MEVFLHIIFYIIYEVKWYSIMTSHDVMLHFIISKNCKLHCTLIHKKWFILTLVYVKLSSSVGFLSTHILRYFIENYDSSVGKKGSSKDGDSEFISDHLNKRIF